MKLLGGARLICELGNIFQAPWLYIALVLCLIVAMHNDTWRDLNMNAENIILTTKIAITAV
jgi:hypothetical protein